MLGGVLGRYIQGGVTFKGALLFSVYGVLLYKDGFLPSLYEKSDGACVWHFQSVSWERMY